MHLDEEQIQRLLHGEALRSEGAARQHLADCDDCRRRYADAEREENAVAALLFTLDDPAPAIDAGRIASRATARHRNPFRWAAGILVAVGVAGAAYAIPGSPLPRWVDAVLGRTADPRGSLSSRDSLDASAPHALGGIAIRPGKRLAILFRSPQADGEIRVALSDDVEVVVRAPIGSATFTSEEDRLLIDNQPSRATYEIQVPRTAPHVEILVDGSRIFLKEGARVSTGGPTDSPGPYRLRLTRSGS